MMLLTSSSALSSGLDQDTNKGQSLLTMFRNRFKPSVQSRIKGRYDRVVPTGIIFVEIIVILKGGFLRRSPNSWCYARMDLRLLEET